MSSRLRWHTSSLANMAARRRAVLRGSGALGLALSWAVTAASKIVLVQDNLSTHKPASLYEAFPAAEARRLVERFDRNKNHTKADWQFTTADARIIAGYRRFSLDQCHTLYGPFSKQSRAAHRNRHRHTLFDAQWGQPFVAHLLAFGKMSQFRGNVLRLKRISALPIPSMPRTMRWPPVPDLQHMGWWLSARAHAG
jgi:hypothetical protein